MIVRVRCACTFLLLFSLTLSSVLTGQSLEVCNGSLRLTDPGRVLEVHCYGQWLPVLPCSRPNTDCDCESLLPVHV